jgi:hypothetical protein
MSQFIRSVFTKPIVVLLASLMLALPVMAEIAQVQAMDAVRAAEEQAVKDTNRTLWFMVGCIGSLVGIAVASLVDSQPPQAALLGKSQEYAAAYTDAYNRKTKSIRTTYGLYGCGASVVAYGLLWVVYFALLAETTSTHYYYY